MNELKPCPFCGGIKIKKQYRKPYNIITCKECGYMVSVADRYEETDGKSKVIEACNRRVTDGDSN